MTSILGVTFILVFFSFSAVSSMDPRSTTSPVVDPGAQSGHESQFVFSEGDVRQSHADDIRVPTIGRFIIP